MHLRDLRLNVLLVGFNGSLKTSDFILDLNLLRLFLDGRELISELDDLLLFNSNLLGVSLGVVLVSRSLASEVVSLLLDVLRLFIDLFLGLLTGMSVSLGLLLVRVDLGDVSVLVVSVATSVRGDSLVLLRLFLGVVSLSSDGRVVLVVHSPVHHHVGHLSLEDVDLTLVLLSNLLVSLDLILDVSDLSLEGLLFLFLGDRRNSLLLRLESILQVADLLLVAGKFSGLLGDSLGDLDLLFLISVLLLLVLGFLNLEDRLLLVMDVLLLDNIGGLDTLSDKSESFILGVVGIILGTFNLGVNLGDLVGLIGDLVSGGDLLLGLRLDDVLDSRDLRDKGSQLMLVGLNLTALGGGGDLGVELLFFLSKRGELALVLADDLLSLLDDLLLAGDGLVDFLFLNDGNLLDLGVLLSQLLSILFLLNDLGVDVRRSGCTGGSSSDISLDGNTRVDTAVMRDGSAG